MDPSRADKDPYRETIAPPFRVLVVDDDSLMRSALHRALRRRDCEVVLAADGLEAIATVEDAAPSAFAVAVVDLRMPCMGGHELLAEIKHRSPATQVIILTGHGTIDDAVRAMRAGADDFLEKPVDPDVLWNRIVGAGRLWRVRHAAEASQCVAAEDPFDNLVGQTPEMEQVRCLARRIGDSDATLLIRGESGTGKEEFARAVHACGKRAQEPFVPVDLASIGPNVIGSELFGHAKGAFTGAATDRVGLIRSAGKGTVLLDEIGELRLGMQATLLRVIQEREVRPIGSEDVYPIEARLIAATNRNLQDAVRRGQFREDLFHRLNVVEVLLPPLRERTADIPELAQHFLDKYACERPTVRGFRPDALARLVLHDWPGNVRELENAVLRAIVIGTSDLIEADDLPLQVGRNTRPGGVTDEPETAAVSCRENGFVDKRPVPASLAANERDAIVAALAASNGHRQRAAEILGIGVATLYRKLKRYKIT